MNMHAFTPMECSVDIGKEPHVRGTVGRMSGNVHFQNKRRRLQVRAAADYLGLELLHFQCPTLFEAVYFARKRRIW